MGLGACFVCIIAIIISPSICQTDNKGTIAFKGINGDEITDDKLEKLMNVVAGIVGDSQKLPDQNLSIDQPIVKLNGSVTGVTITFGDHSIPPAHADMSALEFRSGIIYNSLLITGNYSLYVDNDYVHAESSDSFSINMNDVSTEIYIKLNLNDDKTLIMADFNLDYNATVKINFTNLGGYPEVSDTLNDLINECLPDMMVETKSQVQEEIRKVAFARSDFIFKGMTLEQLETDIDNIINTQNFL